MNNDLFVRSMRGRKAKAKGRAGEQLFMLALTQLGVQMPEEVHTPWRIKRVMQRIVGATPMKKVSGDIRGILVGGRSVLCECKSFDDKLLFSHLQKHQVEALDQHSAIGGLSLLAWKWQEGYAVMRWPVDGFKPGKSLSTVRALALHVGKL